MTTERKIAINAGTALFKGADTVLSIKRITVGVRNEESIRYTGGSKVIRGKIHMSNREKNV